jgi:hypothetical protein
MRASRPLSLEITNDPKSERFRDAVAKAFLEILGDQIQYGPWTVILRSTQQTLRVVMTGPRDTHQEWAFDLAGAPEPAEWVDRFRRRW